MFRQLSWQTGFTGQAQLTILGCVLVARPHGRNGQEASEIFGGGASLYPPACEANHSWTKDLSQRLGLRWERDS